MLMPIIENYNIDIHPDSSWKIVSPNKSSHALPLYLDEWGHFICGDKYYTCRRNQQNYLLFYTTDGCGELEYMDEKYVLNQNSLVVMQCFEPHRYQTVPNGTWDFFWFHFDGSAAEQYVRLINYNGLKVFHLDPENEKASEIIRIIPAFSDLADRSDLSSSVDISRDLTTVLCNLVKLRLESEPNLSDNQNAKVQYLLEYINQHYAEDIHLDDMAKKAFVSKYHLIRVFEQATGVTPYTYLTLKRIKQAKILLRSTNLSIDEIAEYVGFLGAKAFIRAFKQKTGQTPGAYRKDSF